jgi:hypothetical protein
LGSAGFDIRLLMRAIARLGLVRLCFVLSALAMCAAGSGRRDAGRRSRAGNRLQVVLAGSI